MRKKLLIILSAVFVLLLVTGVMACTSDTMDEYRSQGYTVTVTYDPNGGNFIGSDSTSIVDMYNPSLYTADSDGYIYIKLLEPTDSSRKSSTNDQITLTLSGHFFIGWYQTRTHVTDAEGNYLDEDGNVIVQSENDSNNEIWVLKSDTTISAVPAYTYSDPWDFENDTLKIKSDEEEYDLVLYAAWIPYFEFDFYYQVDGVWTLYGSTTYNYKTANAENSTTGYDNYILLPDWDEEDCYMQYTNTYEGYSATYTFPSVSGMTYSAAYLDENRTQQITTGSLKHIGSLNYETGTAVNRIMNIYVDFDEGELYKISTAQQLVNHANSSAYYIIKCDLDFSGLTWPTAFERGTFTGKFYAESGTVTISNAVATHTSSVLTGGLFGAIASGAVISGIYFENATFDLTPSSTIRGTAEGSYALFSGDVQTGASVTNVTISGTFRYNGMAITYADQVVNTVINLLVLGDGDTSGITAKSEIKLVVYSNTVANKYDSGGNLEYAGYQYYVDPEKLTVDEDLNVILSGALVNSSTDGRFRETSYEINY